MVHIPEFWSNVLLACVFPLPILFWLKIIPQYSFRDIWDFVSGRAFTHNDPDGGLVSLRRAYSSYTLYAQLSAMEVSRMRMAYARLGRFYKRIGHNIGYPKKLDQLEQTIHANAEVASAIATLARTTDFSYELGSGCIMQPDSGDLARVRETLKHFVRDWSEEGRAERMRIFDPILDALRQVQLDERQHKKVLVPGAGLGRLAWEISRLGFDTTANEISYFMSLAFRFLLSEVTTRTLNQHRIHPYSYWFSHQRTNTFLFRSITFPDVIPRLSSNFHYHEADFFSLSPPSPLPGPSTDPNPIFTSQGAFWSRTSSNLYSPEESRLLSGYDYIVTLFFIDTSLNVLATLEHIHTLLRPGGAWINLGPLLWTAGAQAQLELSLDEVLNAAEAIGFIFEDVNIGQGRSRTVDCEYTSDKESMMQWIYKAEFWIARKSK